MCIDVVFVLVVYLMIALTEDYITMTTWITEWWHGKDIDSSGTDMIQCTISAVAWRGHGIAGKISGIFARNLDGTRYIGLVSKTTVLF